MTGFRFDFGTGRSNPETFPVAELQEAAVSVIAREADALNSYPGKLGHAGCREVMARREADREGIEVDPEHLMLTNGSMQGVTLTAEALAERGDPVIIEAYNYPGTLSAYRSLGLDLVAIPMDGDGMRIDVLNDTLVRLDREGRRPKFIYTISTYHNPTGSTMPKANRLALIDAARRYDLPLIEDNCYGDVHYDGPIAPALYALDPDPRQIYLCSLSKILAPGLRLGYLLARPPMLGRIAARRHDAGSNTLSAAIVAELYKEGISTLTNAGNAALKKKRDLLLDRLAESLDDVCTWSHPAGGLFVWVRFPDDVDRTALLERSQAAGLTYLPGHAFHFAGEDVPYLRLAFGHLPLDVIDEGVGVLARCLQECRRSNRSRDFDGLFD